MTAVEPTFTFDRVACAATYSKESVVAETGTEPKFVEPAKNVTVPVGAAPELPPEESELPLCVSTKAEIEKGAFATTEVALGVTAEVVGACSTVNASGV